MNSVQTTNQSKSKLGTYFKPIERNIHKLNKFTPIEEMPNVEPWLSAAEAASIGTLEHDAFYAVLNGVLTSRKPVFLLSARLSLQYMAEAKVSRKSMNGTRYKSLIKRLCKDGAFLKELIPWSKGQEGQADHSGYYTIANPEITADIEWWPTPEEIEKEVAKIKLELEESRTQGDTQPRTQGSTQSRTREYEYEHELEHEAESEREIESELETEREDEFESYPEVRDEFLRAATRYVTTGFRRFDMIEGKDPHYFNWLLERHGYVDKETGEVLTLELIGL